jgi:hypothetical protein
MKLVINVHKSLYTVFVLLSGFDQMLNVSTHFAIKNHNIYFTKIRPMEVQLSSGHRHKRDEAKI